MDHSRWVFRKNSIEFSIGFCYLLIHMFDSLYTYLSQSHDPYSVLNSLYKHSNTIYRLSDVLWVDGCVQKYFLLENCLIMHNHPLAFILLAHKEHWQHLRGFRWSNIPLPQLIIHKVLDFFFLVFGSRVNFSFSWFEYLLEIYSMIPNLPDWHPFWFYLPKYLFPL